MKDGQEIPGNQEFTLVIVQPDDTIEIRAAKSVGAWAQTFIAEGHRGIQVLFSATKDLVHCPVPLPGPQTEEEYRALIEEARKTVASGAHRIN